MNKYRMFAYEAPAFWLSAVSVIVGIVQQVYLFLKVRKGKNVTKINIAVSIVLMLLALIFFFCFAMEKVMVFNLCFNLYIEFFTMLLQCGLNVGFVQWRAEK